MIKMQPFTLAETHACTCITRSNTSGAYVELLSFGALIRSIYVPDREGKLDNVVHSYENPAD